MSVPVPVSAFPPPTLSLFFYNLSSFMNLCFAGLLIIFLTYIPCFSSSPLFSQSFSFHSTLIFFLVSLNMLFVLPTYAPFSLNLFRCAFLSLSFFFTPPPSLSVHGTVCLSVCLSVCLPFSLSLHRPLCLSVCLSTPQTGFH